MDQKNDRGLTFPQRNWLLLCIFTAIITVFIYYIIDTSTDRGGAGYNQVEMTQSPSSIAGDTQNATGIPPDSLKH